jgi:subtilisin family serine protease
MARERVGVINVSLVGPRNALLERAVKSVLGRGHLVVAAVGNDGPAARPLFPAAYAGVIGVTAVDGRHRVLVEAGRGPHVAFAALGVHGGQPPLRGTSFAAPVVSALLASRLTTPDPATARSALEELRAKARDLGRPGLDEVYGYGEVGEN